MPIETFRNFIWFSFFYHQLYLEAKGINQKSMIEKGVKIMRNIIENEKS